MSSALPQGVRAIHGRDQEADDFALLSELDAAKVAFVVRGSAGRVVPEPHAKSVKVREVLDEQTTAVFRTVRLGARSKQKATRARQERPERETKLSVKWRRVTLPRPQWAHSKLAELSVHAVHVFESKAPADT